MKIKGYVLIILGGLLLSVSGCTGSSPYGKGVKLFKNGDYEQATKEFQKAIDEGSNLYLSHIYLGRIYGVQKDYEKAIGECRKALDMSPKSPQAYIPLIVLYQLNNQMGEAERLWDKASNLPGLGKGFALKEVMPSPTGGNLKPGEISYYQEILKGT